MIDYGKLEERALAIIHKIGRASTALLQRELNIGYLDSLRILVSLERKGLVVENGSEMRESLLRSLTSAASERTTCFKFFYPLNMFPQKGLRRVEFEPVTIFYGGNGSGKSTVLNIIAARLKVLREIPFRPCQFFDWYVNGIDRDVTEHDGSVTHIHVDPVSFNSDLSEEWAVSTVKCGMNLCSDRRLAHKKTTKRLFACY